MKKRLLQIWYNVRYWWTHRKWGYYLISYREVYESLYDKQIHTEKQSVILYNKNEYEAVHTLLSQHKTGCMKELCILYIKKVG